MKAKPAGAVKSVPKVTNIPRVPAHKATKTLSDMRNVVSPKAASNWSKKVYEPVQKQLQPLLDAEIPTLRPQPQLVGIGEGLPGKTFGEALHGLTTYKMGNVSKGQSKALEKVEKPDSKANIEGVYDQEAVAKGIDNANRLIPGIPGNPTSGDPTKLGKNLLESMGLPRSKSWKCYPAQHIIPSQLNKHPVIEKIGLEMNSSTNGIFLPIPSDDVSSLSRHRGFHSVYNNVVRKQLDKMDVNQDIAVLEKQVYELQQKLKREWKMDYRYIRLK